MPTPDWTSEIVEAMAKELRALPRIRFSYGGAEEVAKAAKAALTAALPMIGKVIVEQCIPGGTHCDPQQITDQFKIPVGRLIVTDTEGEVTIVSVYKTQSFCWANVYPYDHQIVHADYTIGNTIFSYPGFQWMLDAPHVDRTNDDKKTS